MKAMPVFVVTFLWKDKNPDTRRLVAVDVVDALHAVAAMVEGQRTLSGSAFPPVRVQIEADGRIHLTDAAVILPSTPEKP